jgi:hypothetical protein
MKRMMITIAALVALASCDSATGSDRGAQSAGAPETREPTEASFSGGAAHRAAIASVRKRLGTTSALYEARALAVDGGEVTLEVRSSATGFSSLTSGTLETVSTGTGEVNEQFQVSAGTRYLVVAYPSSGGGATLDAAHAHYIEAVP